MQRKEKKRYFKGYECLWIVGEKDCSRRGNNGIVKSQVKMISESEVDVVMQGCDKWEGMWSRWRARAEWLLLLKNALLHPNNAKLYTYCTTNLLNWLCAHIYESIYSYVCVCLCMFSCIFYLQQLKGSQQFPSSAVPSVNLVVLKLWWEPRGTVVLVTHLDGGLCKCPTYELCLALNATLWHKAIETIRGQGMGVRDECGRCCFCDGH